MPTIKVNGIDIYYEDHGSESAPVIVLSPMLFMDTSLFEPMIEAFSDEYRVIAYDHRGQGHSAHPTKRSDLETSTNDVIALLDHLEIDHCHFVGTCLGAFVGLNLAARRSDLLKSCTLMGAIADPETQQTIRDMDAFFDSMKKEGSKTGMQAFSNMLFGESFRASKDPIVVKKRERLMEQLQSLLPGELDNAKQIWHRPGVTAQDLKDVRVPVLIIAGDEDTPENIGAYRKLSEMIPQVTYKTIRQAGYAVVIEQPEEVIKVLREFIEKAEQSFSAKTSKNNKSRTQHSRL